MQMLLPYANRTPAAAGAFCLTLAVLLAGCASKNPLMEEPMAAAAPAAKPAAAPATAVAEAKPAAAAAATSAAAPTGVQTTRQRRFLGIFSPYRPDIQQGNFVSKEMVAQLKEGMTQDQVVFILGAPLLTDMFHADRWDYVFRLQKGNGEVTSSRITVFFKDKRVAGFEGGDLPTENDYLARIAGKAPAQSDDK
jgi:outer membrane protein assembly factor BamE